MNALTELKNTLKTAEWDYVRAMQYSDSVMDKGDHAAFTQALNLQDTAYAVVTAAKEALEGNSL